MAGEYVNVTDRLKTDPNELLEEKIGRYQLLNPGWVPYDGSPEVRLMRVQSLDDAVLLDVASQVFTAIFRYYGRSVKRIAPLDATYAQADTTFTLTDTGFTVPQGLRVSLDAGGGNSVLFQVLEDTFAAGTTVTVPIRAVTAGSAASGIAAGATVQLIDDRTWIDSVALDTITTGGRDAETDTEYLDRLTRKLWLESDTIVDAQDAEDAILELDGVGRVLILDNYIPAAAAPGLLAGDESVDPEVAAQTGVAGAVTGVAISADGSNVPSAVKTAAITTLEGDRLAGLSVYMIDPTRTDVAVTFKFTTYDGWDPVEVKAAGEAAITAALDDAAWGVSSTAGGASDWVETTVVRYADLYAVLKPGVRGLAHVTELKINGSADTNLTISGPGALPNLTSVTGTAV